MRVVIIERLGRVELVDREPSGFAREQLRIRPSSTARDPRVARRHDVERFVRVRPRRRRSSRSRPPRAFTGISRSRACSVATASACASEPVSRRVLRRHFRLASLPPAVPPDRARVQGPAESPPSHSVRWRRFARNCQETTAGRHHAHQETESDREGESLESLTLR